MFYSLKNKPGSGEDQIEERMISEDETKIFLQYARVAISNEGILSEDDNFILDMLLDEVNSNFLNLYNYVSE